MGGREGGRERQKGKGERYEAIKTATRPTEHKTSSCGEERGGGQEALQEKLE